MVFLLALPGFIGFGDSQVVVSRLLGVSRLVLKTLSLMLGSLLAATLDAADTAAGLIGTACAAHRLPALVRTNHAPARVAADM
jgi:hypothetical protein